MTLIPYCLHSGNVMEFCTWKDWTSSSTRTVKKGLDWYDDRLSLLTVRSSYHLDQCQHSPVRHIRHHRPHPNNPCYFLSRLSNAFSTLSFDCPHHCSPTYTTSPAFSHETHPGTNSNQERIRVWTRCCDHGSRCSWERSYCKKELVGYFARTCESIQGQGVIIEWRCCFEWGPARSTRYQKFVWFLLWCYTDYDYGDCF